MIDKEKINSYEGGITLIALIITIVVLIILAAVTINKVTGDEPIIGVTTSSKEEYNVEQYSEQIQVLVDNIILKYELEGKNITLPKIAEEIMEQTTWIKSAVANTDKSVNNEDIIITTTDKYMYQLYYNDSFRTRIYRIHR